MSRLPHADYRHVLLRCHEAPKTGPWAGARWLSPGRGPGDAPPVFCTIVLENEWLQGNALPHFSVTVSGRDFGGCCHDLVLAVRPDLAPLVRMHGRDSEGVPMHAVENAIHWLSGAEPGLHDFYRYRPGSGRSDAAEQSRPSWCLATLAEHLGLSVAAASSLAERVRAVTAPNRGLWARRLVPSSVIVEQVRAVVTGEVAALRPGWRAEAQAATLALDFLSRNPGALLSAEVSK